MIVLYADWTNRIYTITFEFNNKWTELLDVLTKDQIADPTRLPNLAYNLEDASTSANVLQKVGGSELESLKTSITYCVMFDDEDKNWYAEGRDASGNLKKVNHILDDVFVERIGYTFMGWFTSHTMNAGEMIGDQYISTCVYSTTAGTSAFMLCADTYNPTTSTERFG